MPNANFSCGLLGDEQEGDKLTAEPAACLGKPEPREASEACKRRYKRRPKQDKGCHKQETPHRGSRVLQLTRSPASRAVS